MCRSGVFCFFFFSFVFVFFFKQKTAYEIYQCDWSSDVCSSDLISQVLSLVIFSRFTGENLVTWKHSN